VRSAEALGYDRFGHQGGAKRRSVDPNQFTDFSDILGEFFRLGRPFGGAGPRRRNGPQRGEDLRYDLEIDFENAVFGMTPRSGAAPRSLQALQGQGRRAGQRSSTCPTCRGRGEVIYQQSSFPSAGLAVKCGARGAKSSRNAARCAMARVIGRSIAS